MAFESESGVLFQPYNYLPLVEKDILQGYITVSYYENTDPWLYDFPTSKDRLTLIMGYSLYNGLYAIAPSGDRYFTLYNNIEDTPIFIGITGYSLSTYEDYPQLTISISDWDNLNKRSETPDFVNFNIINYSCGIKFMAKSSHTYQIIINNGDPDYDAFVNLTIWSIEGHNVRFDQDLEAEPEYDELRVRAYGNQDPWLEARKLQRSIWTKYIFGGLGIGLGLGFVIFFLKRRYL